MRQGQIEQKATERERETEREKESLHAKNIFIHFLGLSLSLISYCYISPIYISFYFYLIFVAFMSRSVITFRYARNISSMQKHNHQTRHTKSRGCY